MKRVLFCAIALICFVSNSFSQYYSFETKNQTYKELEGDDLEMTIYTPDVQGDAMLPVIVFFFGGGWTGGTPTHFQLQAEYLATRGIIVVCPDYRTKKSHNTSPFECVKDARSAIRYLKKNHKGLRIDPNKIVVGGGSAGGHLAACTAVINNINEETDDLSVSTVPLALVLFNPVVDTGKRGYGQSKLMGREFEISPVHHITDGLPPTLIMHGTDDTTVPYENVKRFKDTMKQAGNSCTLKGYKKQNHGFFNYNRKPKYFKKTLQQTERFLEELSLLKGTSWFRKYYKGLD
jgi:acetyl esterase